MNVELPHRRGVAGKIACGLIFTTTLVSLLSAPPRSKCCLSKTAALKGDKNAIG